MSQPSESRSLSDAAEQIRRARGLYAWLWLSPLLTIPTLVALIILGLNSGLFSTYGANSYLAAYSAVGVTTVLGSGLWHLVLLSRALDRQSEFVRWHGWQALLLAGARTAVALALAVTLTTGHASGMAVFWILGLPALWLFGTLLAQQQADRGECTLMRLAGHGAQLPLRGAAAARHTQFDWGINLQKQGRQAEGALVFRQILVSDAPAAVKASAADRLPLPGQTAAAESADILVTMLRFSQDPARRQAALAALAQLGLVETL